MKGIWNKIGIGLVIVLVVCLFGCSGQESVEDVVTEAADNIVTLPAEETIDVSEYKIVRGDRAGAVIKGAAIVLRNEIKGICGADLKIGTDFDKEVEKEILLGNTKRFPGEELRLGRFKIVRAGDKIAILGGSEEAVLDGVNFFAENCLNENGIICGDGYVQYSGKQYSVTNLIVDRKDARTLFVRNEMKVSDYSDTLSEAIEEYLGLESGVTADDGKVGLILTDDIDKFKFKHGEWGIVVRDGVIYLVAAEEYSQKAVYDYFISVIRDSEGTLTLEKGICHKGKTETRESYYLKRQLVIYPELPSQINRNFDYKVSVTMGDDTHRIPVYDHTMEYDPVDCGIGGDAHRRFSQFAFSGEQVRVDIKVGFDFGTYTVFPSAKKFKSEFKDGVISVFLDQPDYFGIRLDNDDNTILSVFADYPEFPIEVPEKDDPNVMYIEGWYDAENGLFDVKNPNTTLYIAPGAVLNGRVKIHSTATYSKILGRGIILDPFEDIYNYDIRNGGTEGGGRCLCSMAAKGSIFDGPVLLDARCFNLATGSSDIKIRNYKALSSMMTTDGITAGSANSEYDHCWIYCGDNALVVSWTGSQTFRDITIGTTCCAVFPQGSTNNIEMDGIYVFRANGGIINNWYNKPYTTHVTASVTMRNIDCVDATTFTRFFGGRSMGTSKKTYNFINVNLPSITGSQNLHKAEGMPYMNRLIQMENPAEMFTENYTLNFTNLYINGAPIKSASRVYIANNWNNEFTFSNDGTFKPTEKDQHRVRYKAPVKIFVGAMQVMFDNEAIESDGFVFVSSDEIISAVCATNKAETVEFNGVEYIRFDNIKSLDTVDTVKRDGGVIRITLKSPNGNIIPPDSGKISKISESTCYTVDLVVENSEDGPVYVCYKHGNYTIGGVSVTVTDEIKKYGPGDYKLSFKAKASSAGTIEYGFTVDDDIYYSTDFRTAEIGEEWQDIEYTVNINEKTVNEAQLFTVRISGKKMNQFESFSFKDLKITKIS